MARPVKTGLEYFPKDTGSFSDRKIRRLMNAFGAKGYTIFDCVLCEIYSDKGYYAKCDEEFFFDIADILGDGITENLVKEVVESCLRIGLFNKELFDKYAILTSSGVQSRYVIAKRTGFIAEELKVIADETTTKEPLIPKVKESKVNQIKVKESKTEIRENVFLHRKEIEMLQTKFCESDLDWIYDKLSAYKLSTGKDYKSDYGAILTWVVNSLKKEKDFAQKEKKHGTATTKIDTAKTYGTL